MPRTPGTTVDGGGFAPNWIEAVWSKGLVAPGYDPNQVRSDRCGAFMVRNQYGLLTDHGWEIDHMVPAARGGTDHFGNLQPLHWRNNRGKGDDYPNWSCTLRPAA